MTFTGLALSFSMTYLMGVGLASGTFTHPDWNDAYEVSAGALLLAGYNGLGGFGKFCGVILALGLVCMILSIVLSIVNPLLKYWGLSDSK
jgi:hypothetical protein